MLRSRANALETTDHRAQYVACLFFSRLLEGMCVGGAGQSQRGLQLQRNSAAAVARAIRCV